MTGLEELKTVYKMIKDYYGYKCTDVIIRKDEDDEFCELVFEYQGFPVKTIFSYGFCVNVIYPENDEVTIISNDEKNRTVLSTTVYFAICDFIKTINKNRSDKKAMNAFIDYLWDEVINV